jgi:hypothetical protein
LIWPIFIWIKRKIIDTSLWEKRNKTWKKWLTCWNWFLMVLDDFSPCYFCFCRSRFRQIRMRLKLMLRSSQLLLIMLYMMASLVVLLYPLHWDLPLLNCLKLSLQSDTQSKIVYGSRRQSTENISFLGYCISYIRTGSAYLCYTSEIFFRMSLQVYLKYKYL